MEEGTRGLNPAGQQNGTRTRRRKKGGGGGGGPSSSSSSSRSHKSSRVGFRAAERKPPLSRTFCLSPSLSFALPFSGALPRPPSRPLSSPFLFLSAAAVLSLGCSRAKLLPLLLRSCTLCIRFKYHGSARFEGLPAPAPSPPPSPPPPRLSLFCAPFRRHGPGRRTGGPSREAETQPVVSRLQSPLCRPDASIRRDRRRGPRASNIGAVALYR